MARNTQSGFVGFFATCLFCHFLPVQPEDDDDVERGLYHDANEESQPKTCGDKQMYDLE